MMGDKEDKAEVWNKFKAAVHILAFGGAGTDQKKIDSALSGLFKNGIKEERQFLTKAKLKKSSKEIN